MTIPVIANGDIVCAATARQALAASKAAGVMVGRGAQGKPWLLAQIASDVFGSEQVSVPMRNDFYDMVAGHYEAILTFYGEVLGVRVARKHLGWYMDTAGTAPALRKLVLTAQDPKIVLGLLAQALLDEGEVAA